MNRDTINSLLRSYAKQTLTPNADDRKFVSDVYASVRDCLGTNNCLQIGSYPRYTAIRPLHDLDVLYFAGAYANEEPNPAVVLADLLQSIEDNYDNPTDFKAEYSAQSHSITIRFLDGDEEAFSVDIVPGYTNGSNEFGLDKYIVPEILNANRKRRAEIRKSVADGTHSMTWIPSDPRGYIHIAQQLNDKNADFRRAVKIAKAWRNACKENNDDFPLKSFHIEQALVSTFSNDPGIDIFGAIFAFMTSVHDLVRYPRFPDRADPQVNIDDYVNDLSQASRRLADKCRDWFMIQLEELNGKQLDPLFYGYVYERAGSAEKYLFDQNIPLLSEYAITVIGELQQLQGGFARSTLGPDGYVDRGSKIQFRISPGTPIHDLIKWKVKNDDSCAQPRGEITDHHTLNAHETAQYDGIHYVEAFAIVGGVCVGRGKQYVRIRN